MKALAYAKAVISHNEAFINDEGHFDQEESTDLYDMRNGVLTYLVAVTHDRRMMNTGKNHFLFPNHMSGYKTRFHEFFFNPKTNEFVPYDVEPKNPASVLKNWKKHWQ